MLYRAHISAVCLVYFASLLIVHEREEGVLTLHLPTEPLNIPLWIGAIAEMRTPYLPSH